MELKEIKEILENKNPEYAFVDTSDQGYFLVQISNTYKIIDFGTEYSTYFEGNAYKVSYNKTNLKPKYVSEYKSVYYYPFFSDLKTIKNNNNLKNYFQNERFLDFYVFLFFLDNFTPKVKFFSPNTKNPNLIIPSNFARNQVVIGRALFSYLEEKEPYNGLKNVKERIYKFSKVRKIYSFICYGKEMNIEKII
ncbi:MAG: hypothetical protein QXX30_00295 [Candidatus Aenigmatarchaeota archaeon]